MYKDGGAGLSKTVKGRGAELGKTVKGKGSSRGQDTGDIDSRYSYPLVDPRPEEAPDINDSTLLQCTGADGSLVHPLDVTDNPLYSQHLEDNEHDNEQDANGLGVRQDDERDDDQDSIDPGAKRNDERDDDQDTIDLRGDVYEGRGAGLNAKEKVEGAGPDGVVRRIKGGGRRATRRGE